MKKLETERLILRDWQVSDADDYYEMFKDPDVQNMGAKICSTYQESLRSVRVLNQCQECWAIVLKNSGVVIGSIWLENRPDSCKEIEYGIAKRYQNNGYVTEAIKRVLEYSFTELALSSVVAYIYIDNLKSIKVIQKCGFTYVETSYRRSGSTCKTIHYSISKEKWSEINER